MKIVHLSLADGGGGAHVAARRLHEALWRGGTDSTFAVNRAVSGGRGVAGLGSELRTALAAALPSLDLLPVRLFHRPPPGRTFFPNWVPDFQARRLRSLAPDLLHLHWVSGGGLRPETLAGLRRPVVWTLHDMWPFTGGCQYAGECTGFAARCGRCPALGSSRDHDLSRRGWNRRRRAWHAANLHLVAPSRWMAEQSARSSLFHSVPCSVIPNAIDTERFRPRDKAAVRALLGLPQDRPLILFSATDGTVNPRKGFPLLRDALCRLRDDAPELNPAVVLLGPETAAADLPFPAVTTGFLHDELSLSLYHAAADLFVMPSREDNLPNTVMEAMACGTPAVGFRIGGMPDLITHGETGCLAAPFDSGELAAGIRWLLTDRECLAAVSAAARRHAETHYACARIAERHRILYEQILGQTGTPTRSQP